MGIEFYGFFQARVDERWEYLESYDFPLGCALQYWLAPWDTVPEGGGSGCISAWRGAPADLAGIADQAASRNWRETSWLMADEILAALPLIERQVEVLEDWEFQKKRESSYWDFAHAYWTECRPRLIEARKIGDVETQGRKKIRALFITDRSAEVGRFVGRVQALRGHHEEVRFVFGWES